MDYAHVTNGAIDLIGLPDTWARPDGSTVSGYRFLDPAEHTADGWLPVVENRPELGDNEFYGEPSYDITHGQVVATYPVTLADLPADPDLIPPNTTRLRSPR